METESNIFSEWGPNAGFVKEQYRLFLTDPALVTDSWRSYFENLDNSSLGVQVEQVELHQLAPAPDIQPPGLVSVGSTPGSNGAIALQAPSIETPQLSSTSDLQIRVTKLVNDYRTWGHLIADINPLSHRDTRLPLQGELDINSYRFTQEELPHSVNCDGLLGFEKLPLQDVIDSLEKVYAGTIGVEFMHLERSEERLWLQQQMEGRFKNGGVLSPERKHRILQKLIIAEAFESELHRKYVGQKRFSLQGGETTIPLLDTIIADCGTLGVKEVVVGMAHRGRLNVLANTLGKSLLEIFSEFEDQSVFTALGSGDVKYHLGFESEVKDKLGNDIKLNLCPNPSHLEFVNPVVEGVVRAKQDEYYSRDRLAVLPLLLHGDAAMIGQGVVPETLNLSLVPGYETGGTIHLIINNQIGFTTNPSDSRSCTYCTDVAKAFQAPVFHINAEDPEAACWAARVAFEFRCRFKRDVVLDLYCYRKYGHNEADDPSFTQPLIYSEIKGKELISSIYKRRLLEEGAITEEAIKEIQDQYKAEFEQAYNSRSTNPIAEGCALHGRLRVPAPATGVPHDTLKHIASTLVNYPESFVVHPKLEKILQKRVDTLTKGEKIDWAFAEALAFGSLVLDGVGVRLSGQDCGRGTFSQRHLVLRDYRHGEPFLPLEQLTVEAAHSDRYEVYNSTLSEAAVLGFEFGYATVATESLILWEAQFGDFANGAQVIVDQFISSSEAKWDQMSGVVMLLPHGFEGQGPEHSSARLERYLQLCAEGNMVVCNPTTASQYFHLLRRQGVNTIKRPLIVMTPKSLLRHPEAATAVEELTFGTFHTVLEDSTLDPNRVKNLVFLTGKVCYDVRKGLHEVKSDNTAIVRIEQLSPFPIEEVKNVLKRYPNAETYIWAQEEPRNMGAWGFIGHYFRTLLNINIFYAGRPPNASTATGSAKRHAMEQKAVVDEVLKLSGNG